MTEPWDKQMPRRGHGRTIGGNISATGRDVASDRGRRDQMIQEENLERASRTIPLGACLDTPPHLEEFDRSYIREYSEDVVMRRPVDIPWSTMRESRRWWRKHVRTISMSSQRIWRLTTGFRMSFIPTSMYQ